MGCLLFFLPKNRQILVTGLEFQPSDPLEDNNSLADYSMKSKYLTLLGLTLGLGIATAQAGGRSFGDELPEFLQQFDLNEDGEIDEEERQAIRENRETRRSEWLAKLDEDGDGEISQEEREAARDAFRARIEEKRAERFNGLAGDDGSLSLEEFAAIPGIDRLGEERIAAIFARMDEDESGDVSGEEFNSRLRHHRLPERPEGGWERPERPEGGWQWPERPEGGWQWPERPEGGEGGEGGWPGFQELLDKIRERLAGGGGEEEGDGEEEGGE